MTTVNLLGTLIAADDGAPLRYRLLTFGEVGRTNQGAVTIDAGALTLPDDPTALDAVNMEHDSLRPVGRVVSLEAADGGLTAEVRTLDTTAGRDARIEAREGVRAEISVEIADVVIRAGRLIAGRLTGMGLVTRPAFPSSMLTAADAGDLPDDEDTEDDTETSTEDTPEGVTVQDRTTEVTETEVMPDGATVTTETETHTETTVTDPDTDQETPDMGKTIAATAATGGTTVRATERPTGPDTSLSHLTASLGQMEHLRNTGGLLAALSPITQADAFDTVTTPEYVGELWEGRSPVERYAPLVRNAGALTSYRSQGWRFTQGPEVHPYAGNLADITSTPVEVETEEITAYRLAGGNRLDRVHMDLPDEGFWQSYLRHSAQDYAVKRDATIGYHMMSNALPVEFDPTGIPSFYSGSAGWAKLVRGARIAMRKVVPTFAVVGADLWEEMALTPREYALEYLSAQMGLDDTGTLAGFRIIGASDEPIVNIDGSEFDMTGKVMVGTDQTTLMQELPGGPIRVNAEVVDKGGIDHGVFGYLKVWTPTPYNVLVSDV